MGLLNKHIVLKRSLTQTDDPLFIEDMYMYCIKYIGLVICIQCDTF